MSVTIEQNEQEAHNFLKNHTVGVLATVDPNGEPHAAAIYYFADEDFTISFITKTQTKKADNLQHNNHAVLVVYEPASQTTVQITGTVSAVTELLEVNDIFRRVLNASLETSQTSVPPIAKLKEGDYIGFRLTPKQIRMAAFRHSESGEYADLFKTFAPADQ